MKREAVDFPSLDVLRARDLACATFASHLQSSAIVSGKWEFACCEASPRWGEPSTLLCFLPADLCMEQTPLGALLQCDNPTSVAPWAHYFSRDEIHLCFQLASSAQFSRTAKHMIPELRTVWAGVGPSSPVAAVACMVNQPSATSQVRKRRSWGEER